MRPLVRFYPLTFAGSVLFAVGVYLLSEAYRSGNAYALLFGGAGVVLLLALAVTARLIAFRLSGRDIVWEGGQAVVARAISDQIFHLGPLLLPPFFRVHVRLSGVLEAGRDCPLFLAAESAGGGSGTVSVPVDLPVPGVLLARARLFSCDVFGLVRAHALELPERSLLVRPPPFSVSAPERYLSQLRDESVSRRTSGDDEKFYMRQYMAGDRLKDVNWKASVRTSELITRISPESPERSQTFLVELRPYTKLIRDDAVALIHLSYARSWLFSFVRAIHFARPKVEFRVLLGDREVHVRGASDLDALSGALASVRFSTETPAALRPPMPVTQRFVFSTPYDQDLPRALVGPDPTRRLMVFRTRFPGGVRNSRTVRFFASAGADLLPGRWYFRRPQAVSLPPLPGVDLIEEPLEVRRW